jgi:hypothetical protein
MAARRLARLQREEIKSEVLATGSAPAADTGQIRRFAKRG